MVVWSVPQLREIKFDKWRKKANPLDNSRIIFH